MERFVARRQRRVGTFIGLVAALALTFGFVPTATAAGTVPPIKQRGAAVVSTDALPTVQINGVVYAQVVVGDRVYVAGEFSSARPAGASPGTDEVPRSNILAYDLRTGVMTATFAPKVNAKIKALAVSPDGKLLYAVGNFTKVGTANRNRFAAFDTATGALNAIAPDFNYTVNTLAVTAANVYVGGGFTSVNGVKRTRLAAVNATSGALRAWAPTADAEPRALVVTPNQSLVVVGGSFAKLNTTKALGMGALDAKTGESKPWKANATIKNYGENSAILTLSTDGTTIFGAGYASAAGNFEGVFAAAPTDGTIKWLQDCHGDTYSVAPVGDVVYSVGHAHFCQNIGGFPDTEPRTGYYRALAVTKSVGGTVATNGQPGAHYGNFAGQPAPSLYNWFPNLEPGTYTGLTQSAWSVVGTAGYLLLGGEFTKVNGVKQQGLVRMAIPATSPGKQGPMLSGSDTAMSVAGTTPTAAGLTWTANWDRDDTKLYYDVVRNGTVVYTRSAYSQFWSRPSLSYIDSGLTGGTTYSYQLRVRDGDGNTATSTTMKVTTPNDTSYATGVRADGASHQWRLDAGTSDPTNHDPVDTDQVGDLDLTLGDGVTAGVTGVIPADSDQAVTFGGDDPGARTADEETAGPAGSAEIWFRTSTPGGRLLAFGNPGDGGHAAAYTRSIALTDQGQLAVTVGTPGADTTLTSTAGYADGSWHQAVAVQSAAGIRLYADGALVATGADSPEVSGSGRWEVGSGFTGTLDEAAVYPTTLTSDQVLKHFRTARGTTN